MSSKEITTDLSRKDQRFLDVAIALAKTSKCRNKHGAIIVSNGRVLATGVNVDKNNPMVFD